MGGYGIGPAISDSMQMLLAYLGSIPEAGRLALIGLSLIAFAVVARKFVSRVPSVMETPPKVEAPTK